MLISRRSIRMSTTLTPMVLSLLLGAAGPVAQAAERDAYNLVGEPDYSGFAMDALATVEEDGASYILVHTSSDVATWAFTTISFPIDTTSMKKLQFAFGLKIEDVVKGPEIWNTARIYVNFFDEDGKALNNYDSPSFWTGTKAWKDTKWTISIPKTTTKATVGAGMDTCTGTFHLKDLTIYAIDANKAKVKPIPAE